MPSASRFARSRAMKACVALCAVSALAFVLGQGAAALRVSLASESATVRPQIAERVMGAQGTIATPAAPPTPPERVTFTTDAQQTRPPKPKDRHKEKQRPSHEKAAGDSSHGGSSHVDGGKSHGHDH